MRRGSARPSGNPSSHANRWSWRPLRDRVEPLDERGGVRRGHHAVNPIAPGRRRRSFQFGRASAPIIPHAVHTMRGENAGTDTSSG